MKIYVGTLSFNTAPNAVETLFSQHGLVDEVHMPTDRETGRPRGFAFVTMPDSDEAKAAITALNGTELDGRRLNIDEARPSGGGGGGRGFGGRRGGGGGGGGGRGGGRGYL